MHVVYVCEEGKVCTIGGNLLRTSLIRDSNLYNAISHLYLLYLCVSDSYIGKDILSDILQNDVQVAEMRILRLIRISVLV